MGGVVRMSDIPDAAEKKRRLMFDVVGEGKPKQRKLYEVLPTGVWKGRPAFIIGGGPSLRGFDFSKLKGEIVVTVNRAFETYPDSVLNVAQDARLWGWYEENKLPYIKSLSQDKTPKDRFHDYKGFKCWMNVQVFPFPEDIFQIDAVPMDDYSSFDLAEGVPCHSNSGLNAIMIAACLGANPIYLLGFDCKGENGRTSNFHSGYPESDSDQTYRDSFLPDFKDASYRLAKKGVRVINLNPESALQCFEFGRFEDLPKVTRPIYVSFYTEETAYEKEIEKLETSLRTFGLEYDFFKAPDMGSWRANIHGRIQILKNFLLKYPKRDIVYIDADGVMCQYPTIFDNFKSDFGIVKIDRSKYWPDWKSFEKDQYEYLGGTMYLKNNKRMHALLDLWEKLDAPMETRLSQQTLIRAIEQSPNLKIQLLPKNYCQIYDIMACEGEPVVEHFQASRRSLYRYKKVEEGRYVYEYGSETY